MKQEEKITTLNKFLQQVVHADPLTEYTPKGSELTHSMNYGLAQIYAVKEFRDYIEDQINKAIYNVALRGVDPIDSIFAKARILTLKELLVNAKVAYTKFEKVVKAKSKQEMADAQKAEGIKA